jgi:hypothetical protein
VEEMTTQKKMSRKTPQNQEKLQHRKGNVPENEKGATNDVAPYYILGITLVIFS